MYLQKLVASRKFVQLETMPGVYAMVDCNEGVLSRKWLLVEEREFVDENGCFLNLFVCDCALGHENKVRLSSITSLISREPLSTFRKREEQLYCVHCEVAQSLKVEHAAVVNDYRN